MTKSELKSIILDYIDEEVANRDIIEINNLYNEYTEYNNIIKYSGLGDLVLESNELELVQEKLNNIIEKIKKKAKYVIERIKSLIKKFELLASKKSLNDMIKLKEGRRENLTFYTFYITSNRINDNEEVVTVIDRPDNIPIMCDEFITLKEEELKRINRINLSKEISDNAGTNDYHDNRRDIKLDDIKYAKEFLNNALKTIEKDINSDNVKLYSVVLNNCIRLTSVLGQSFV